MVIQKDVGRGIKVLVCSKCNCLIILFLLGLCTLKTLGQLLHVVFIEQIKCNIYFNI